MAVTIQNLQNVEMKAAVLRGLVAKKAIADGGTFTYQNPLTGASVVTAVAAGTKTDVTNAYKAALADLQAAVAALKE